MHLRAVLKAEHERARQAQQSNPTAEAVDRLCAKKIFRAPRKRFSEPSAAYLVGWVQVGERSWWLRQKVALQQLCDHAAREMKQRLGHQSGREPLERRQMLPRRLVSDLIFASL